MATKIEWAKDVWNPITGCYGVIWINKIGKMKVGISIEGQTWDEYPDETAEK